MSAICIIDTSIFCEILGIPDKHSEVERPAIVQSFKERVTNGETILLPIAVMIETGNHIGQIRDGRQRRTHARSFHNQLVSALSSESPNTVTPLLSPEEWISALESFPDWCLQHAAGLGDHTIVNTFERQCELYPRRRVYVWSKDRHLIGYDRTPDAIGRR